MRVSLRFRSFSAVGPVFFGLVLAACASKTDHNGNDAAPNGGAGGSTVGNDGSSGHGGETGGMSSNAGGQAAVPMDGSNGAGGVRDASPGESTEGERNETGVEAGIDGAGRTDGQDGSADGAVVSAGPDVEVLKRAFADLRFGMFLHFGMNTFSNDQARDLPNQDPALFNPTNLDPGQWMDAAQSAGMKFAVLTVKHHDGFLLWDSATTDYDVGNDAVPQAGHKDVVKLFVDACRARGIAPGLYFSIQDRSVPGLSGGDGNAFSGAWNVTNARMPRVLIDYVKSQIRELLTNYGFIPFFVTDGYAWSMGTTVMPMQEIRELVYELSPNTLYSEHQGQQVPWHDDIVYFEEPKGGAFAPPGNILASWQSQRFGHAWFWTPPDVGYTGLSVANIVTTHLAVLEPRYCNFAPDFGPNRQGLLEPAAVALLRQVGQAWVPNATRPPLPAQPPHLDHLITAVGATATSTAVGSDARFAIDGINDGGFVDHYTETVWQSATAAPQSLTIDLGVPYANIDMLSYQPPQIAPMQATMDTTGRITGYGISYSLDGVTFTQVVLKPGSTGVWQWNAAVLVGWASAEFQPVRARYVRLEARSATGANVKINEVDVGGRTRMPLSN